MKKRIILGMFIMVCLLCIGVKAKVDPKDYEKEMIEKWCWSDAKDAPVSQTFSEFAERYEAATTDWVSASDGVEEIAPKSCNIISEDSISCTYESTKTKGNYRLLVSADNNKMQTVTPNGKNMSFTITGEPGMQVSMFVYPNGNASTTNCSSCDKKVTCYEKGVKNDSDPSNLSNEDIERNALFAIDFSLPTSKTNDFYNNNICKDLRKKYKNTKNAKYAELFVPECYDKDEIDILTNYQDIQEAISALEEYINNKSEASDKKDDKAKELYCQFDKDKNITKSGKSKNSEIKSYKRVEFYQEDNPWYSVTCTEDMTIEYDKPKSTYAGGGFKYTVKLTSTETCKIKQIRKPVKPPICRPSFYFSDTGGQFGGPNEDYISCIEDCDGGLYGKSCSDKCYQKVYENDSSVETISFIENNANDSKIKNVLFYPGEGEDTWCYTQASVPAGRSSSPNRNNYHWEVCPSKATIAKAGQTVTVHARTGNKFNSNQMGPGRIRANNQGEVYGCVYGWQSNPCTGALKCKNKCSIKSVETKAQQLQSLKKQEAERDSAKRELLKKYKNCKESPKDSGNFTCDPINTTQTAVKNAKITRTVKNIGNPVANDSGIVSFTGTKAPDIYPYLNGEAANAYYINFPKAYISLINGSIEYNLQDKQKSNKSIFGGYLFYTDVNTTAAESNDIRYFPYNADLYNLSSKAIKTENVSLGKNDIYNGRTIDWNIKTQINDFGSNKQWKINVNCYYGADISVCKDPPCECQGDKCRDIAGLPYIYRTVNLKDMFPDDRTPGYNWTNAAYINTIKGYDINPEALTASIEDKKYGIYCGDDEEDNCSYVTLKLSKDGLLKAKDEKNDYTDFIGSYSNSINGVSFFTSAYLNGNASRHVQKVDNNNRTN